MAIKVLSEYFSNDNRRSAKIYVLLPQKEYNVSVMNEAGSSFTSMFENINDAEDFAENWVMLGE